MKTPAIPENEQGRLEALRALNILDTPAEERFDRLTRLAKRIFDVPIALVTLVDENRQWFKSCVGLEVSETSRAISFCGHAILGDDIFIIPDAQEDERFADNPLVTDAPNIRFYAGCPLSASNGRKLGTLCVIDTEPRAFEDADVDALKDLASMAESELSAVRIAMQDELTNTSNRRGFMALAPKMLHLCSRQGMPASLAFLDLDKFKPINDTFGHSEGDRALTAFAETMKQECRDSDLVARLGGDEFAILLANTSKQAAEEIIARIHHSLEKRNREANRGYNIQFSYGIVEFDRKKHDCIDELLIEGGALMYETKRGKP